MGMFEALVMKEGDLVPLKDVIGELDITHDDAVEFLKRVGYPVFREGELITRTQYRILVRELGRYKDYFVPNTECHNCGKHFDHLGPKYECGKCGHVFCSDCMTSSDSMLAYVYPSLNGRVLCKECAYKEEERLRLKEIERINALQEELKKQMVIGMYNRKAESKETLTDRLLGIFKMPSIPIRDDRFPNAMCYCPAFPDKTVTITHKCPTCRCKYEYELTVYDGERKYDRYRQEESTIDDYVHQIKDMGYDVKVEHMCKSCYQKKYKKIEDSISVNVLYFKYNGDGDYTINVVTAEDCEALLQFLKGNNAMKLYGDWVWIKRYCDILSRILGINFDEL